MEEKGARWRDGVESYMEEKSVRWRNKVESYMDEKGVRWRDGRVLGKDRVV